MTIQSSFSIFPSHSEKLGCSLELLRFADLLSKLYQIQMTTAGPRHPAHKIKWSMSKHYSSREMHPAAAAERRTESERERGRE